MSSLAVRLETAYDEAIEFMSYKMEEVNRLQDQVDNTPKTDFMYRSLYQKLHDARCALKKLQAKARDIEASTIANTVRLNNFEAKVDTIADYVEMYGLNERVAS